MRSAVHNASGGPAHGRRGLLRSARGLTLSLALLALAGARPLAAQAGPVGGTVLNATTGRPLIGAQVVVEGTQRGSLTDANGRFLIQNVPGTTIELRVVMLGYQETRVTARVGDTSVRINMAESAIQLDEIVVTGQPGGTQKRAIGNSIAKVDATSVVGTAQLKSMQELINGRAPGVVIMPGTGMIGSGSVIRVRGNSTFSLNAEPLIYVDGVRVLNEQGSGIVVQAFSSGVISRLNDFNPNDVESVEILKGPAAATLYGTEASRGVINIITKKGAPGGARYSLSYKRGGNWFSDPEGRLPVNYWKDPTGKVQSLNIAQREKDLGRPLFRNGRVETVDLSIQGGTEGMRYYLGFDTDKSEGAEKNNWKDQISTRANLQILPNENLDISVSTGYVKSRTQLSCEAGCGGTMWGTVFSNPALLGENCAVGAAYGCGFTRGFQSSPPEVDYAWDVFQDIDRFTGSVTANWRPFSWLTHRLTIGTDLTAEQNEEYMPRMDPARDSLIYFLGPTTSLGYKYQTRRTHYNNTFDYAATVNRNLRQNLNSATSVGVQYYQKRIEFIGVEGDEFAAPGLETVASAARKTYTSDDYLDNNTLGAYVQEQLSWNDRLFFTAALRVDNNSAFGEDIDYTTYPKASLSWVLNEEPKAREMLPEWVNALKLRLAYGQSGQQPLSFSALRTYTSITGPNNTPAVTPSNVGNPNLKPERGHEIEAGFDAGFLDSRLGLEFTYYHKRTTDAILLKPNAPSGGFTSSSYVNAGEILNTGIEALLKAQLVNRPNVAWDVTLSAATNSAEVKKLTGSDTTLISGSTQSKIGYAPRSWFRERVVSAKYDQATNKVTDIMCDNGAGGTVPCYTASGAVAAPRVYLGRTTPSFEGSISTGLRLFNRLTLNSMLDVKAGYKKYDNNLRARCQIFSLCLENMYPERYDAGRVAEVRSNGTLVSFVVNDASFARLREVSLTYDAPDDYAGYIRAKRASINVAARNLYTWTNWTGLDPENQFLSGGNVGLEQDNLPQLMSFVVTFNVSF